MPRKRPRRRIATAGRGRWPPTGANQVWAYDFVFDACANGQQLKCLTVVDEFTRECLAIDVGWQHPLRPRDRGAREAGQRARRAPLLRSDNGPEFISRAILRWLADAKIETALIDPGKPWQNGSNESFNGKFRDECLSWSGSRTAWMPRS